MGACWWWTCLRAGVGRGHQKSTPGGPPGDSRPSGWGLPGLPWGGRLGRAIGPTPTTRSAVLAKHHYNREKREKELKRQRKREEKEQRRVDRAAARTEGADPGEPADPDVPAPE